MNQSTKAELREALQRVLRQYAIIVSLLPRQDQCGCFDVEAITNAGEVLSKEA